MVFPLYTISIEDSAGSSDELHRGTAEAHGRSGRPGNVADGLLYRLCAAATNVSELSDVPADKMNLYETLYSTPVHHGIRVPKTRWVVLRYPNASMAQLSGTSTEAFEDFYFQVCNLDYSRMGRAMKALVELMNRTDRVRLTGKDTDLTFSIKNIPAIACDRPAEHSRRRGVHGSGPRFHQRSHHLQHALPLSGLYL